MPAVLGFISPGPVELIVLAVIILLLFGNRLPGVMRSLGRGVVEFKRGISGTDDAGREDGEQPSSESKP